MTKEESLVLAKKAKAALEEKKAIDVKIIDISEVSSLADYFVIASAMNKNQLQALVDNVDEKLGKSGYEPRYIEGKNGNTWVLLDYNDVVIHLLDDESREFYNIEHIWRDGVVVED